MNKKLENFIILLDILFVLSALYLFFIRTLLFGPNPEGPPLDLPLVGIILLIEFIISIIYFWNKPINKSNKKWIEIVFGFLFFIFLIIILYVVAALSAEKLAIGINSESLCELSFDKDRCIKNLAIYRTDDSLCEKIINKIFLEDSGRKAQCYWKIAVAKSDLSLCEKAGSFKDNCIININNR